MRNNMQQKIFLDVKLMPNVQPKNYFLVSEMFTLWLNY